MKKQYISPITRIDSIDLVCTLLGESRNIEIDIDPVPEEEIIDAESKEIYRW